LNIELLLKQLKGVFPELPESPTDLSEICIKIETILRDKSLNIEERADILEAFLIEYINIHNNIHTSNLYKLALKMVLLNRGYFTDMLGKLEAVLLLLPEDNALIDLKNKPARGSEERKKSWLDQLGHTFINSVRIQISECVDQPGSLATIIRQLLRLMKGLCRQHQELELDYLNLCLSKIREQRIISTTIEHSRWAEVSLATLRRIQAIKESNSKKPHQGTESMARQKLMRELDTQRVRGTYYSSCSTLRLEPLGYFVEAKVQSLFLMDSLRQSPRAKKAHHFDLESIKLTAIQAYHEQHDEEITLFGRAYDIFINHSIDQNKFVDLLDIALRLKNIKSAFAGFVKIVAMMLSCPLSKALYDHYFQKLQQLDLVIPENWRLSIAQIWLKLSEYFHINGCETRPYYRLYAINCCKQISDRYGLRAFTLAKLQHAKILNHSLQIKECSELLSTIKPDDNNSAFDLRNHTYSKQIQYLLVSYLLERESASPPTSPLSRSSLDESTQSMLNERLVDKFRNLMAENYPHGLEIAIGHLLNDASNQQQIVIEAVRSQFGEEYINPLILCKKLFEHPCVTQDIPLLDPKHRGREKVESQIFNRYLMIWAPIYINAISNNLQPAQINEWRNLGFNDNAIRFKLYTYARSLLYAALHESNDDLVPGGCDYLLEMDTELISINLQLITAIKEDKESKFFAFARDVPGLLEALLAEIAYSEKNYTVVEQLANTSISFCTDIASYPRKNSQPSTSPRSSIIIDMPKKPSVDLLSLPISHSPPSRNSSLGRQRSITRTAVRDDSFSPSPASLPNSCVDSPLRKRASTFRADSKPVEVFPAQPSPMSPRSRNRSASEISPSKDLAEKRTIPSYLGYLLRALVIWHTKIENNINPNPADIKEFQKNIEDAKSSRENIQEHYYIRAKIWLMYQNTQRNPLWISEHDLTKLAKDLKAFKKTDYAYSEAFPTDDRRYDYLIIKQARSKLVRALTGKMFPPASLTLAKDIYYWQTEYDGKDQQAAERFLAQTVGFLEEAIGVHGYNPSLHYYGLMIRGNLEYFRNAGSIAFLLKKIKTYLDEAELFIYLDPGIKKTLISNIATAEKIEADVVLVRNLLTRDKNPLIERIFGLMHISAEVANCALVCNKFNKSAVTILNNRKATYPTEHPQKFDHSLITSLPLQVRIDQTLFNVSYREPSPEDPAFGFQISAVEKSERTYCIFEHYIELATRFYIYSKKINFQTGVPLCRRSQNSILIPHADIFFIAMIKMLRANDKGTDKKIAELRATSILTLLREANTIPAANWQWSVTHMQLQDCIKDFGNHEIETTRKLLLGAKMFRFSANKDQGSSNEASQPHSPSASVRASRSNSRRSSTADLTPQNPSPSLLDTNKLPSPRSSLSDSMKRGVSLKIATAAMTADPLPLPSSPRKNANSNSGVIPKMPSK
jgi:hypothetical protein